MKAAPMYALAFFIAIALAACEPLPALKGQGGKTASTAERQADPR